MFTIAAVCTILGFFLLYHTSENAKLSSDGAIGRWAATHPAYAKPAGLALILSAFLVLAVSEGAAAGVLKATLLLTVVACLTIVLAPLRYLTVKHIFFIVAGSFLCEIFIA